ncbi:hypothetical protein ENH_00013950 [Eimeria necatrix]|uniref:Uncharacterized protein n=1 Tax=Eimeria necatrix TaxID=51315 RepID=U6MUE7_9EIME|nr:hypothetical protein ENH_00013950 [Eimeria necatrix]CDJ66059.1 hypothetical protein ENH_00013950 [Eimeria necatrix]
MTPTAAPKVKALGLAEGLLPSEELITHHWRGSSSSSSSSAQHNLRKPGQQQRTQAPFASLWSQISTIP